MRREIFCFFQITRGKPFVNKKTFIRAPFRKTSVIYFKLASLYEQRVKPPFKKTRRAGREEYSFLFMREKSYL
jgi:hypothetical protein